MEKLFMAVLAYARKAIMFYRRSLLNAVLIVVERNPSNFAICSEVSRI